MITVVEGATDLPFAQQLVRVSGGVPGTPLVQRGHGNLDARLRKHWNRSSNRTAMLVLRDLDPTLGATCAVDLIDRLTEGHIRAAKLSVRIAVREVEAWLLADTTGTAEFFGLSAARLPHAPEQLADPKSELVKLCRHSRYRHVREGMVPRARSGRIVGPDYEGLLREFGLVWDPVRAAARAPSLKRAIASLTAVLSRAATSSQ